MEIEKKYLLKHLPDFASYEYHKIEQAYLSTNPVVRVRKEDNNYYMTYKGSGMLAREEYNLPLNQESYEHLKEKADGNVIGKTRYMIPFESEEQANAFETPEWFGEEVTFDGRYHNSYMSRMKFDE